jgi:hypothetical protein
MREVWHDRRILSPPTVPYGCSFAENGKMPFICLAGGYKFVRLTPHFGKAKKVSSKDVPFEFPT